MPKYDDWGFYQHLATWLGTILDFSLSPPPLF